MLSRGQEVKFSIVEIKQEGNSGWVKYAGDNADGALGNESKHSESQSSNDISSDNENTQLQQQPIPCQEEILTEPTQHITKEVNNFQIILFRLIIFNIRF